MRLYATLKNERGGKKSAGDDTRLLVELSYKNKIVGTVGLYAIEDSNTSGYRVVWTDERGFNDNQVIREEEIKGKQQTDELMFCTWCGDERAQEGKICKFCGRTMTYKI